MNLADRFSTVYVSSLALLLLPGCVTGPSASLGNASADKVDFVTQVKPILNDRCIICHNRKTMPERTSFENGALALKGDKMGPIILPGNAAGSRLLVAISSPEVHETAMPPVSLRVKESEVALIRNWIDQGASWPQGPAGEISPHSIPLE